MAMTKGLYFNVAAKNQASPALRQVTGDLRRLRSVTGRSTIANRKFGEVLGGSTWRRQIQQAGMQVSDFSVQVAGGQSAILAFTQNAPQFLQNFGAMGGVIAATVTILGTLWYSASRAAEGLEEAKEKARTFEEVMTDMSGAVSSFQSIVSGTTGTLEDLTKEYGQLNDDTREFIMLQRELAQLKVITEIGHAFDRLLDTTDFQRATGDLGGVAEDILEARRALEQVQEDFGMGAEEAQPFIENLRDVEASYASLTEKLAETPTLGIMDAAEDFAAAMNADDVNSMNDAIIMMRKNMQELPTPLQTELLPTIVQMEAATRRLARGVADSSTIIEGSSKDALAKYRRQILLETKLLGISQSRARVLKALGDDAGKYTQQQIDGVVGLTEAYIQQKEALDRVHGRTQEIADTISGGIDDALMSVLDRTKTFGEKMRSILSEVITELYQVAVVKRIVGSFDSVSGRGTGLMGILSGGNSSRGLFGPGVPFLNFDGGGHTGGNARAGGLDGKGGFMAMLHPRETVIDHTKGGSSGGGVTIIQNNTFEAGSDEAGIAKMLPLMKQTAVAAVQDYSRRRIGGLT